MIDSGHEELLVSVASGRCQIVQPIDLLRAEYKPVSGSMFFHTRYPASTGNGGDVLALSEKPSERDCERRSAPPRKMCFIRQLPTPCCRGESIDSVSHQWGTFRQRVYWQDTAVPFVDAKRFNPDDSQAFGWVSRMVNRWATLTASGAASNVVRGHARAQFQCRGCARDR